MRPRNLIAALLVLVSLGVLIPGLSRPLITIRASIDFMGISRELFSQTRSILGTVRTLHESGNDFVAALIFFFSVAVPFIKLLMLGGVALARTPRLRFGLFRFVRGISKWAMADVFVVGVYIAFLSAKATDAMDAELHEGFYWFVAYCLVSLLSTQLMLVEPPETQRPSASSSSR